MNVATRAALVAVAPASGRATSASPTGASVTRATGTGIKRMAVHPPGLTIRGTVRAWRPPPSGTSPFPAVF